jgi:ABC-type amino acid transport substrate-binding protein
MKRIALVLAALAIVATACGTQKDEPEASSGPEKSFAPGSYMADLQEKGKITIGVKFDVPQFGFKNPTTDDVEGFDVDMGNEIAKALGVRAEFVEAISKNRIPFLNENKVDIVFSTMTITDERKKQIDFSDVYYVAAQSFLSKKDKPEMTVENAAGKKVCTAKGSTSELNLPAVQPDVEMVLQDGYAQCVQLLRNDQVDAVSTDDVILLQFLKQDPNLFQVSSKTFSQEPYGAGIKKGRSGFKEFVDGVIEEVKSNGRWATIYKKWVTPVTKKEPPEPPAADVKFSVTGLENPVTPPPTSAPPSASAMPSASATPYASP